MSGGEGGGVGDEDVTVGAAEDGGMTGADGVDVLAGGEGFGGPLGVVPACSFEPCSCGLPGGVVADALLHLGEGLGAVEINGELLLAGSCDVGVGVNEAGHYEGAVEIDDFCLRGLELEEVCVGACCDDLSACDGHGGDASGC